jgi:hypothetical protein
MSSLSRWILVAAMCVGAVPLHADEYEIYFLDGNGGGVDATGTFTYANGIYSNFDVSWNGYNLELNSSSSSPANCAEAVIGVLSGCPSSQTWDAGVVRGAPLFFIDGTNAFTAISSCFSITQGGCAESDAAAGTFTVIDSSVKQAPEIDPAWATSSFTFLLGGLLTLRGRRR